MAAASKAGTLSLTSGFQWHLLKQIRPSRSAPVFCAHCLVIATSPGCAAALADSWCLSATPARQRYLLHLSAKERIPEPLDCKPCCKLSPSRGHHDRGTDEMLRSFSARGTSSGEKASNLCWLSAQKAINYDAFLTMPLSRFCVTQAAMGNLACELCTKRAASPLQLVASPGKLRILCLHGFRQNADLFRGKLTKLIEDTSDLADFVFLDAPHTLPFLYRPRAKDGVPCCPCVFSCWLCTKFQVPYCSGLVPSANATRCTR